MEDLSSRTTRAATDARRAGSETGPARKAICVRDSDASRPIGVSPCRSGMRFSAFTASGRFGIVTLRTPLSKACFDLVGVDGVGDLERSLEAAVAALHQVVIVLLLFALGFLLTLQCENAVVQRYADVLLIHARQLGLDDELGLGLAHVDARHDDVAVVDSCKRGEPPEATTKE